MLHVNENDNTLNEKVHFPNENDKTLKLSAEEAHVFNFLLCTKETYNKEINDFIKHSSLGDLNAMDSVLDEHGINYLK
jgi:hypothetical protein